MAVSIQDPGLALRGADYKASGPSELFGAPSNLTVCSDQLTVWAEPDEEGR